MKEHWLWKLACFAIVLFFTVFMYGGNAVAALSALSLEVGSTTGVTNATITPNFDGTDDSVNIRFTPSISGSARVIIDTDSDDSFEAPDWSSFDPETSTADFTAFFGVGAGEEAVAWWEGRNIRWNVVPNGTYKVKILVDADGDFSTTSDQETDDSTLTVTVETAYIKGRVTDASSNPLANVVVRCGGPQGGGEGVTDSTGNYTVPGLIAAASYHVNLDASRATGTFVNADYANEVIAAATDGDANTGIDFALNSARQITGTITIPSSFLGSASPWDQNLVEYELGININAWNTQGPGWGWAHAHIHASDWPARSQSGQDQDGDGTDDENESLTEVSYTLNVPPGVYKMRAEADGYASATFGPITVASDASPIEQNIALTAARSASGTVTLSTPASGQKFIEVSAVPTDEDYDGMAWGGGRIDSGSTGGGTTIGSSGYFQLQSILPGTYVLKVRVDGFASYISSETLEVTEEGTGNIDLGNITLGTGSRITGTITILGDTTDYQAFAGGGAQGPLNLWVNAFNPEDHVDGSAGTNVQIQRGVDQSATFTIGGLPTGDFEVSAWLGEGYEIVPDETTGNMFPVATITTEGSTASDVNLTFSQWSGVITGSITPKNSSKTIDYDAVLVKAMRPDWFSGDGGMWRVPVAVKPNSSGVYTLEGLGTGEYVLLVNEYQSQGLNEVRPGDTKPQWELRPENDFGASGNFGRLMVVVSTTNGRTTTKNLVLEDGYSITGNIVIDPNDPVYNSEDCTTHQPLALSQLGGLMVNTTPIRDMMMGGRTMSNYRQATSLQGGNVVINVNGLAPGTYMLTPDTWLGDNGCGTQPAQGAMPATLFGTETITVTITDSDVTGADITIFNGYDVSGTVNLPEAPSSGFEKEEGSGRYFFHLGAFLDKVGGGMGGFADLSFKDFSSNASSCNEQSGDCLGDLRAASFKISHVPSGGYIARGFSPNYAEPATEFTVDGDDVSGLNLNFSKGASIIGKLVDAETGSAVSGSSGVTVFCEAVPWVPGSYRETRDDDWSKSKINSTTGAFTLTNLPAGTYVVEVENRNFGFRTDGSVNYAGYKIANVVVSEDAANNGRDVDVGTIRLVRAVTITGKVTNSSGVGLGNIQLFAEPENSHSGVGESFTKTNADGKYTLYVSPNTEYYEVIAAERPDFMTFLTPEWGEVSKRNVLQGAENVNFVLQSVDSTLTGSVTLLSAQGSTTPSSKNFGLPMDMGDSGNMPVAMIILQEQGRTYTDPMDGIEAITAPSDTNTTSYVINGIVAGTYTVKVFSMDHGTRLIKDVVIDGSTSLNIEMYEGATVTGEVRKSDGSNFTITEINTVVAFNNANGSINFGKLVSNSSTKEVTGYSVSGLQPDTSYKLSFLRVGQNGPEGAILMAGNITSATTSPNDVAINADDALKPNIIPQVVKSGSAFNISLYSTQFLTDDDATGMFAVTTGTGAFSLPTLSPDKRSITAVYTPGTSDTSFAFELTMHYGTDNTELTPKPSFGPYLVDIDQMSEETLNTMTGGDVSIGNGNASGMSFGEGDISDVGDDGEEVMVITSSETLAAASQSFLMATLGIIDISTPPENTIMALPTGVTAKSDYYTFSGITLNDSGTATVTLEYNSSTSTTDEANLDIYYSTDNGSNWTKLGTDAESIDISSDTISDSTSVASAIYVVGLTPTTGGGGGDTAVPGVRGNGLILLSLLMVGAGIYQKKRFEVTS